ncbi:HNH endonuclease [PinkBerry-associated phage LS06-2018-MD08]|nr:HNH endonuclease [PinkBerry-associated phage LS06-2018-MD08]
MEQWKAITNYEGYYEVSNLGRVKIVKTDKHKIMIATSQNNGHPRVKLSRKSVTKDAYVSKLVAQMFIDNPLQFKKLTFKDGDRFNMNADNIMWGDDKEMLFRLGFTHNNTHSVNSIIKNCNVREMFYKLIGEDTTRTKKTWFYGRDMYNNVPKVKFNNTLGDEMLDIIWEKWIKYDEDTRA